MYRHAVNLGVEGADTVAIVTGRQLQVCREESNSSSSHYITLHHITLHHIASHYIILFLVNIYEVLLSYIFLNNIQHELLYSGNFSEVHKISRFL